MGSVLRDHREPPLSLSSYRRMTYQQARHEAEQASYTDAVFIGFCYGLAAGGIAWLVLSGVLGELLVVLVRAGRMLVGVS
jgi:hypothetical protein